jgi:mono/diheme cytochrome c family protein
MRSPSSDRAVTPRSAAGLWAVLGAAIIAGTAVRAARAEDLSSYQSGAGLYHAHCASCHGAEGHGDGPVAASLTVEVPDLTRIARRQGGRFPAEQLRKIIDGRATLPPHGTRAMPVWGPAFSSAGGPDARSEQQASRLVDLLVQYLQSIQTE